MTTKQYKPHRIDVFAGQTLNTLRKRAGLSQEELAGQIGVSFQQIQKYEKAQNRMSISRLWEIAEELEVDVLVFFPKN